MSNRVVTFGEETLEDRAGGGALATRELPVLTERSSAESPTAGGEDKASDSDS